MTSIWDALWQTWPVRMAQSAFDAAKLPGDVYTGNAPMLSPGLRREDFTDMPGTAQPNDATIGRAADLASLIMSGTFGIPPNKNILGSGPILKNAKDMSIPKELYHVAGSEYEAGQPLRSLYSRKGNDAYDEFARRWPESGNLGQYHAHKVMFFDNKEMALDHAILTDGTVLTVNPSKVTGLTFDKLEKSKGFPGYWSTKDDVPPDALSLLKLVTK